MKTTKEEYLKILKSIEEKTTDVEDELRHLEQFVSEYFDNPPLKFEEIEAGMWVWRDESKSWMKVYETYIADYGDNLFYEGTKVIIFISNSRLTFSSNYDKEKYYRKQVVKNE